MPCQMNFLFALAQLVAAAVAGIVLDLFLNFDQLNFLCFKRSKM